VPFPRRTHATLDSYEAERADFARVVAAIHRIQAADLNELRNLGWIYETVCSVGLCMVDAPDVAYGEDLIHLVNASHQGITQVPLEFARWLRLLADLPIRSYLEVGCYNGNTACLATAYLQRLNPQFQAVTIDLWPWFLFYREVRNLIPLEYRVGVNSFHLVDERFDAVFIDGDHSFEWTWADYQNVGRSARVCGLHDVNSQHYFETLEVGGCPTVWELIKQTEGGEGIELIELFDHPAGNNFGIGARLRRTNGEASSPVG
jgi:hypothetical protein